MLETALSWQETSWINSLFATVFVCSLGSIVEPARVFNSDLVALLRLVDAVAPPDELFL